MQTGGRAANGRTEADGWTGGRGVDGRTVAGGRTGGGRAAQADVGQRRGGRVDGGWANGRTAQRMEADRRTSGRAHESGRGRGQGGLAVGRTGGRAGGLKGPAPRSPASLSSAQTTRLTAEQVCRALGSALGS